MRETGGQEGRPGLSAEQEAKREGSAIFESEKARDGFFRLTTKAGAALSRIRGHEGFYLIRVFQQPTREHVRRALGDEDVVLDADADALEAFGAFEPGAM